MSNTTKERVTCPRCNGHGFLVRQLEEVLNRRGDWVAVETDRYAAPTDKQAESDMSDLDPKACNCFLGTVTVDRS